MAIKNIIARGIGFAPGSIKFIPTHGFISKEIVEVEAIKNINNLMYIEQVTFRAPYNLTLIGGDDDRLSIFLKQRGLPSI